MKRKLELLKKLIDNGGNLKKFDEFLLRQFLLKQFDENELKEYVNQFTKK